MDCWHREAIDSAWVKKHCWLAQESQADRKFTGCHRNKQEQQTPFPPPSSQSFPRLLS